MTTRKESCATRFKALRPGAALKTSNFSNWRKRNAGRLGPRARGHDAAVKAIKICWPLAGTLADVDRESANPSCGAFEPRPAAAADRVLDAVGQNCIRDPTVGGRLKRPGVRGGGGELQLRRVVESLVWSSVRFESADASPPSGGCGRRVIICPGGKHVVVDAKAPLEAYLKRSRRQMKTSAAAPGDHAGRSGRTLPSCPTSDTPPTSAEPDFVVMFLPGEMFFRALEQDPTLIEFGVELRVIPASPTRLIAAVAGVAYGLAAASVEETGKMASSAGI